MSWQRIQPWSQSNRCSSPSLGVTCGFRWYKWRCSGWNRIKWHRWRLHTCSLSSNWQWVKNPILDIATLRFKGRWKNLRPDEKRSARIIKEAWRRKKKKWPRKYKNYYFKKTYSLCNSLVFVPKNLPFKKRRMPKKLLIRFYVFVYYPYYHNYYYYCNLQMWSDWTRIYFVFWTNQLKRNKNLFKIPLCTGM